MGERACLFMASSEIPERVREDMAGRSAELPPSAIRERRSHDRAAGWRDFGKTFTTGLTWR